MKHARKTYHLMSHTSFLSKFRVVTVGPPGLLALLSFPISKNVSVPFGSMTPSLVELQLRDIKPALTLILNFDSSLISGNE
jgi:hypothetical protein